MNLLWLFGDGGDPLSEYILAPGLQWGFGFAFVLAMGFVGWLIKSRREDWQNWLGRLITLQEQTNKIIAENSAAFRGVSDSQADLCEKLTTLGDHTQRLYEAMLSRPCLVDENQPRPSLPKRVSPRS